MEKFLNCGFSKKPQPKKPIVKVVPVIHNISPLETILNKIKARNPLQQIDMMYIQTLNQAQLNLVIAEFNFVFKNYCFEPKIKT